MAAQRAVMLKLLLIYLSTIKKKCFNQPDGISITLLKEDMFTGKNLLLSSVFCSCHKRKFALRSQKNSILLMLLILCGDIESQPGRNQFTREEFQQKFLSGKGLKIVHQNIRGILSNLDTLEEFITSHSNIDIISLSETHLNDDNAICCKINGYTFLFKNRSRGKGGGVAFYIKENITFERRFDLENSLTESIWIQINQKNSKPFLVGCFYKPPETSKYLQKNYNELLLNDLTRVSKQNNETIILGDFNINYHDPANGKNFKSLFSQMGYYCRTLAVSILSLRFCVFIAYCLVRVQPFIASPFQRFITSFYRIRIPLAPSKYLYYMLGFNYFDSLFVFLRRSFL